ncbi:MAG TPA: alpha/beta family hydrolase [Candidatus Limnocylindria bacterium]
MTVRSLLLAPGASGNEASVKPFVDAFATQLDARLVKLPKGQAERAVPAYLQAVAEASPDVVIGGQSFGGRVASLLAAEEEDVAGLILFCYPLHPPGRAERWEQRTEHWPRVACPVLLLSGDRDPFARIGLLEEAVKQLPDATLHVYPGVGHGLRPVLNDALDRVSAFVQGLERPVHSRQ